MYVSHVDSSTLAFSLSSHRPSFNCRVYTLELHSMMSVISDEALNYYTHHSFIVTFFILDFRLFYSAVIKSLIYNTHIPRRLSLILEDVSLLFSFRFITSLLIINKSITWPNLFPHNFINSHNKLLTNLSSLIHFPLRRYPICCFNGNHTSSYDDSPSVTLR